jgi:GNAT superfamily N-acetyltransferase
MDSTDYLHLQLRLEGKSVTGGDRLHHVEEVPGEDMPLMILAHLAGGHMISYYDESLPPELYAGLKDRIGECEFPMIVPLLDFLKSAGISIEVGHFKTHVFPEHIVASINPEVKDLSSDNPLVQAFGFGGFAGIVYAIERGGGIVSACMSVRENGQCGEAWVYTDPQYRHQGFARQAVSTWAQNMLNAGKIPFYSHKMNNLASANLAKRLDLQPVFEEISISYKNV